MKTDSIWKDNKTLPEFGRDVLIMLNSGNYIVSDTGNFEIFHPIKWCYVDDLLSQSDRIEKLEQALDMAKEEYNQVMFGKYPYDMRESMEQKYDKKIESILKGDNDE